MKLIETRKNNTLIFRLKDGRIAASYASGYVRITAKWLAERATPKHLNDAHTCYQLNKTVKVQSRYRQHTHDVMRVMIENESDRIDYIKAFEARNC